MCRCLLSIWALAIAISCWLIHIKGQTVEWNLAVKINQALCPNAYRLVIEEVKEHPVFLIDLVVRIRKDLSS